MVAIAAALCLGPPSIAKPKPKRKEPPPAVAPAVPPQVVVVNLPDGRRTDLAFDGPLLGWALPRSGGGRRTLIVLVGPKRQESKGELDTTCLVRETTPANPQDARLYRWRPEAPDRLAPLGSGLPEGALDSADLDGDGNDEQLLQHEGRVDLVTTSSEGSAETRALVEDAELGRSCCGPRGAWDGFSEHDAAFRVTVLGAFRTYRRDPAGGVVLASEVPIPARVNAGSARARIASPAVHPIGVTSAGRVAFATEPEALGERRLRTLLIDPDGPPATQVVESWSLFPQPERVVDTAFSVLDGEPVLVVTTISAEKLSLLGEKALRIFPLGGNRTRAGDPPIFAATTGINLWQTTNPAIIDLDRDGRDDLVLAYWKGLKNAIASLEIYRGGAGPRFAKARSMSFDVEGGDKGFMTFGPDADGDGRPDLILLAEKELLVFPGVDSKSAAEKPVATRPSRRVALPADFPNAGGDSISMGPGGLSFTRAAAGLGTPQLVDLDGDGRPEALFAGNNANGAGRLSIVALRGGSPLARSATIPHD
jgi:hypothetical protein